VEALSEWTVPGYTELKPLGSGGFGSVVLARHDATGTAVAVKYLLPALRHDPEFAALFRTEAEALGSLDDPHVVRLYEYVESASGAAIVMELIDGVTLWDILSQHGRTTPEAALVVLYGSLLGLAAAHARGVVHRDFKPRNVLVNAHGASKLTDFGIAARAGTPTIPSGSVAYAPPEQFEGGPASPASDVYAATATFYECLAGRPPFTGPTNDAVIWQHHSADVPMDPVPEPLQPIIARGLAKDPKYRPADAAALAAALRAVAADAYGPDWEQRGRWGLGAAAVALAALWPSVGVPALHVASAEQVNLTHSAQGAHQAQAGHQAQAVHHGVTKAGLHRWHLRHLLHQRHLTHLRSVRTVRTAARTADHVRNIAAVVATGAVVAAGVTVAATSRPPAGPGTAAQPVAATYQVSPAPAIPAGTLTFDLTTPQVPIGGRVYVEYGSLDPSAFWEGEVPNPTPGEVVRLYAQQFPYNSPPVPVQSTILKSGNGSAVISGVYQFSLSPTVATRYQVELFSSATATTPLAISASKTVYVINYTSYQVGTLHCTGVVALMNCVQTMIITAYFPPAELQAAMAKPKYLYLGNEVPQALRLDPTGSLSAPQRVADNAYQVTASYRVQIASGKPFTYGFCTVLTESLDGLGLPNEAACGQKSIAWGDTPAWGGASPV
jgi:hypothetical protein